MADLAPYASDLMLVALANAANAGTNNPNATLQFYTNPKPPTPIDGATGVLLTTILLPDPAISGPSNGVLTLNLGGLTTSVVADGRVAWFRFRTKDNTTVFDGTVGLIGSGADIELELIDFTISDILNIANVPLRFRCP